ncbi:MAG: TRAP transporter large permease [Anaerotruncus sp.]|nr:TRAP transporter large permease [Anaerotruncus sp.]
MTGSIILICFFVLMFLGIPIAIALTLAALFYMLVFVDIPPVIIAQQILSGADKFTLLALPFFMIAGSLMEQGGISKRIVNFARSLVGALPGGMAIVTIVSSMIFASMTGAGAATTAAVGSIMIPAMRDDGYDIDFACALQASSGIFGPLIPPSTLMVLYGVTAGVSIGDMLLAGLLPGLFMGLLMIIVAMYICCKNKYRGSDKFNPKEAAKSLLDAFWALLTPVIILGGIYSGKFTPTEAAGIACFYSLIVGLFVYRELTFKNVLQVLYKSFKLASSIMLIVGATQAFGWVLTREGIPQAVAVWFNSMISNPTIFMLAVCVMLLVSGCFLDAVPALLLFAPILCPTAVSYGINLMHFGVVMVVTLCIGLVTPPVGLNLFVASSVGGRPAHKIIPHLPPFLATMVAGMLLIVLIPQISIFLPTL